MTLVAMWGDTGVFGQGGTTPPNVSTHKFDYLGTENVLISGIGFQAEQVTLKIEKAGTSAPGNLIDTIAAAGPSFSNTVWDPADTLRGTFVLTATGTLSGRVAKTIFTVGLQKLTDDAGADDLSGQKDLNFLTIDYGLPGSTTIVTTWGWDDTAWSGNNTGDACTLFDASGDGDADYSLCITVGGTPAAYLSTRMYRCGAAPDFLGGRSDRCTQPTLIAGSIGSSGTGTIPTHNSDPFGNPNSSVFAQSHTTGNKCNAKTGAWPCVTDDVVALLVVNKTSDFNGQDAKLINVCSYPSQEPNSDPSDCVVTPNSGFLTIVKNSSPTTGTFSFKTSANSIGNGNTFSITTATDNNVNTGQRQFLTFTPTTLDSIREVVPSGWSLSSAACAIQTGQTPTPTGTTEVTGNPIPGGTGETVQKGVVKVEIREGLETICTFTDVRDNPILTLTKTVTNTPYGGTASPTDWKLYATSSSKVQTEFDSGDSEALAPGTYTLSESSGPSGYSMQGWTCTPSSALSNGNQVTLTSGTNVSCSVNNIAQPATLVVKKVVNNNSGGTAAPTAFSFTVTGLQGSFTFNDDPNQADPKFGIHTLTNLAAGTYTVTETDAAGYTTTYSGCQNIQLPLGGSAECTITNTDQPATLIVKKVVNNTAGDTKGPADFSFTVSGLSGSFTFGDDPNEADPKYGIYSTSVSAGTYTVTETPVTGYTASYSGCTDIVLTPGGKATCTITNTDSKASPSGVTDQLVVLHDSIAISGIRRNAPDVLTGNNNKAIFRLYTDATCSTTPLIEETVTVQYATPAATTGTASTATGYLFNPAANLSQTGNFYWKVEYTGDAYNAANPGECGSGVEAGERATVTLVPF